MTGEVDLNGNVHAIGGLEAKLFGAIQSHIYTVLIPKQNDHDYKQFENKYPETKDVLTVHFVDTIDEVLSISICKKKQ